MKRHDWAARTAGTQVLLCAVLLGPSGAALAAGFAINELGAREQGMGNAVTAVADRPSAIVFNPAGLAQQEGLLFDASLSFVMPAFGFDTNVPSTGEPIRADAERDLFLVPSVYLSYRVNERIGVGLGIYSPYGLAVRWDKTLDGGVPWWGRTASKNIDLKTMFINPTVALKLSDRVFLGAGFIVAQAAVTLERSLSFSSDPADDVDVKLSGDDVGFGATVGLLVKLVPQRLNVGVSYRSAVDLDFSGKAAFTRGGSPDNIPAGLRQQLFDSDVKAPLTLPHVINFGIAAFPLPNLIVSANIDLLTWSSYDKLSIAFTDEPARTSTARRDWDNTFAFRLGAEYQLLGDNLPVRLGLIFDQSPVPDDTVGPDLPDADRFIVTLGAGYTWRGIRADVGYQFIATPEQQTGENVEVVGSRDARAHIVSLGLGYGLDL